MPHCEMPWKFRFDFSRVQSCRSSIVLPFNYIVINSKQKLFEFYSFTIYQLLESSMRAIDARCNSSYRSNEIFHSIQRSNSIWIVLLPFSFCAAALWCEISTCCALWVHRSIAVRKTNDEKPNAEMLLKGEEKKNKVVHKFSF